MPPATIVQGMIGSELHSVTADAAGVTGSPMLLAWIAAEQPVYAFDAFTTQVAPSMARLFGTTLAITHYTDLGPAPRPVLVDAVPRSIVAGGSDVTLHVTGYNFTPRSVIVFNGGEEPTVYVSAQELTTTVAGATATTPGDYPVAVRTAAPGGGDSGVLLFAVLPSSP